MLNLNKNDDYDFEGLIMLDNIKDTYLKHIKKVKEIYINDHEGLTHIDELKIFTKLERLTATGNAISMLILSFTDLIYLGINLTNMFIKRCLS